MGILLRIEALTLFWRANIFWFYSSYASHWIIIYGGLGIRVIDIATGIDMLVMRNVA